MHDGIKLDRLYYGLSFEFPDGGTLLETMVTLG